MDNEIRFFYNSEKYHDGKALGYAETQNKKMNVHDVSKTHLTQTQIAELAQEMNIEVKDLVDTNNELYLTEYKNRDLPSTEWLKLLQENPQLMRTPIAVTPEKTFIVEDAYLFVNRDMDHGGIKNKTANQHEKYKQ